MSLKFLGCITTEDADISVFLNEKKLGGLRNSLFFPDLKYVFSRDGGCS